MSDVKDTTNPSILIKNANDTLVMTLAGHITVPLLQHLLKHLLLHIVTLRDKGKRVLFFIDTTKVTSADNNITETALQFLQTDCDHVAIYSSARGHRSGIQHLVKQLERHDHVGVFRTEDEATAWMAHQESLLQQ